MSVKVKRIRVPYLKDLSKCDLRVVKAIFQLHPFGIYDFCYVKSSKRCYLEITLSDLESIADINTVKSIRTLLPSDYVLKYKLIPDDDIPF